MRSSFKYTAVNIVALPALNLNWKQLVVTDTKLPQVPHASLNLGLHIIWCQLLPKSVQMALTFVVISRCSCERKKSSSYFFFQIDIHTWYSY